MSEIVKSSCIIKNVMFDVMYIRQTLVICILIILGQKAIGQTKVFIKPNVVFTLDSNKLKPSHIYGEENYTFNNSDSNEYIYLSISYGRSYFESSISVKEIDSIVELSIDQIKQQEIDSFELLSIKSINLNGFRGVSYLAEYNDSKGDIYVMSLVNNFSAATPIAIMSTFRNSWGDTTFFIADSLLNDWIQNITIFDSTSIDSINDFYNQNFPITVDSLKVRNRYMWAVKVGGEWERQETYDIDSVPTDVLLNYRRPYDFNTFRGRIHVSEALLKNLKRIEIEGDKEGVFAGSWVLIDYENPTDLIFDCSDTAKGSVTKSGKLIIEDPSGLEVVVPFTFSYENSGK